MPKYGYLMTKNQPTAFSDTHLIREYCQGTINKTIYMDEILTDLNHVLSMDADHVAGLILRGSFDPKEQEQKLYAWKACRKNPDAQVYIPITDLNHPDINRFVTSATPCAMVKEL